MFINYNVHVTVFMLLLGNNPPIITGPRQLIVSVANGGVAHYSAIDPDDGMETSLYLNVSK